MDQLERAKKNMCGAVVTVLINHSTIWSGDVALARSKNKLDEILMAIEDKEPESKPSTIGTTDQKNRLKVAITEKIMIVTGAISSRAAEYGDLATEQEYDLSYTNISTTPDAEFAGKIKSIVDYAALELGKAWPEDPDRELVNHGVNQELLDDVSNSLEVYKPLVGMARDKTIDAAVANASVGDLIEKAEDLLERRMDKQMRKYKHTNRDFYEKYIRARDVIR